ncbi:hypothetical protein BDQ12DRAFT_760754, partial [Crucibulum laeve]
LPTPMSLTFKTPIDGSFGFLEIIEYNRVNNAKHSAFRYQNNDAYRDIPWSEAAEGFHRSANLILNQTQLSTENSTDTSVIAILAATGKHADVHLDSITYTCLIIGIMQAGYTPFPISTRNSAEAITHLLITTKCTRLVVTDDPATKILGRTACELVSKGSDGIHCVDQLNTPTFTDLFESKNIATPLPVQPRRQKTESAVIFHSSGSVSFPKPITFTYKKMLEMGTFPTHGEIDLCGHIFSVHCLPMYRTFIQFISSNYGAMLGLTVAAFSPYEPVVVPSPEHVFSSAKATKSTLIFPVPSFLESWARNESSLEVLKSFRAILFGGGPLSKKVGDMLSEEGINLTQVFGITETGPVSIIAPATPPTEGWDWLRTSPHVDAIFIPEIGNDEVFRLIIKESDVNTLLVSNMTIDGIPAYDTNDLVIRHPKNGSLWQFYGRHDDQITHSTGVRTNPIPMESTIREDPRVSDALIFGHGRLQVGVLVLPSAGYEFDPNNEKMLAEYRNSIWDTIQKVNEIVPQYSRIFKEMIIVATPAKPFEYTAKRIPRRAAVLASYASEIEEAYRGVESFSLTDIASPAKWDVNAVTEYIREVIRRVIGHNVEDMMNIFEVGADSLSSVSIRNALVGVLHRSKIMPLSCIRKIPQDFAYHFPTIAQLSGFIYGMILAGGMEMPDMSVPTPLESPSTGLGVAQDPIFNLLEQSKDTVVKIKTGSGEPPLIVLHAGIGGRITALAPLQNFTTAVWAIQMTEQTPKASLNEIADFYYMKIKEQQPVGPYRLAGYSGSSLLTLFLARIFQDRGDDIMQLALFDHFPTLFLHEINPDSLDVDNPDQWSEVYRLSLKKLYIEDSFASRDTATSSTMEVFFQYSEAMWKASTCFLLENQFYLELDEKRWSQDLLKAWLSEIKSQVTVYVASEGIAQFFPEEMREDLGARAFIPNCEVINIVGDHYDFFEADEFLNYVQAPVRPA